MKSRVATFKLKAFTLTELLVVMVIIGILVLLALPNLMPLISSTHAQEAKVQLTTIHTMQNNYRMAHSRYSSEMKDLSLELPKTIEEGGTGKYRYTIESADKNAFLVKAEAIEDFDGDGVYNVWTIDQNKQLEELIKD